MRAGPAIAELDIGGREKNLFEIELISRGQPAGVAEDRDGRKQLAQYFVIHAKLAGSGDMGTNAVLDITCVRTHKR